MHALQRLVFQGRANLFSFKEIIQSASQERMNEAEISQPTTTAIQIALVDLLMAWDIKPSVTIGHSSGTLPIIRHVI